MTMPSLAQPTSADHGYLVTIEELRLGESEQHVLAWLRRPSPERLEQQEAVAQIKAVLVQRASNR